jgi:4-amino-4-deoxy-L-arabinose transferase-like glycosyltransferase
MTVAATLPDTSRRNRSDVLVLAVAAVVLRVPAFFAARDLHPDDGFYGMAVVAMRQGGVPYKDVFSSQGPLHLPLLYVGDLLGLRTFDAPRVTPVLAGIAATVLTYAIGRRIATRTGALIAAIAVATSGSVLWVTSGVTSDGPTLAFALGAFLAALRYREAPSAARAVTVALLLDGAILVKPALGLLAGVASVFLVVRVRRGRDLALAAAAAAGGALVVSAPFGLGRVWRQAVHYQLSSQREASITHNIRTVVTTLWNRDALLIALVLLAVIALALMPAKRRPPAGDAERALWLWAGILLVFLVIEPALWRNHMSSVIAPIALLVALRPPPLKWLAIAAIVVVPLQVWHLHDFLAPSSYEGPRLEAHQALAALPDGAWALSDDVGLVWRAHTRTTDDFVDTSIKRQEQGQITAARIAEEATNPRVCAVLVWSTTHWGSFRELPRALADVGYEPVRRFAPRGSVRVLYERPACNPQ